MSFTRNKSKTAFTCHPYSDFLFFSLSLFLSLSWLAVGFYLSLHTLTSFVPTIGLYCCLMCPFQSNTAHELIGSGNILECESHERLPGAPGKRRALRCILLKHSHWHSWWTDLSSIFSSYAYCFWNRLCIQHEPAQDIVLTETERVYNVCYKQNAMQFRQVNNILTFPKADL